MNVSSPSVHRSSFRVHRSHDLNASPRRDRLRHLPPRRADGGRSDRRRVPHAGAPRSIAAIRRRVPAGEPRRRAHVRAAADRAERRFGRGPLPQPGDPCPSGPEAERQDGARAAEASPADPACAIAAHPDRGGGACRGGGMGCSDCARAPARHRERCRAAGLPAAAVP